MSLEQTSRNMRDRNFESKPGLDLSALEAKEKMLFLVTKKYFFYDM